MENEVKTLSTVQEKNTTPYIYIVLSNIGGLILTFGISALYNWVWEEFDLAYHIESTFLYSSANSFLYSLSSVLIMALGFAIIKDLKLFILTLGCKSIVGMVLNALFNLITTVICCFITLETIQYAELSSMREILIMIISTALTCLLFKLLAEEKTM